MADTTRMDGSLRILEHGHMWKLVSDSCLPRMFVFLKGVVKWTRSDGWMMSKSIFCDDYPSIEFEPLFLPNEFEHPLLDMDVCLVQNSDQLLCIVALDSNNGIFVIDENNDAFSHTRISPPKSTETLSKLMVINIAHTDEMRIVAMNRKGASVIVDATMEGGIFAQTWLVYDHVCGRLLKWAGSIYIGDASIRADSRSRIHRRVASPHGYITENAPEEDDGTLSTLTNNRAALLYLDDMTAVYEYGDRVHLGSQGIVSSPLRVATSVASLGVLTFKILMLNDTRLDVFPTIAILTQRGKSVTLHTKGHCGTQEREKPPKKPVQ